MDFDEELFELCKRHLNKTDTDRILSGLGTYICIIINNKKPSGFLDQYLVVLKDTFSRLRQFGNGTN